MWMSSSVYLGWNLELKLMRFLLCPILGKSLKGGKACQRQSFHVLQLSTRIWYLLVTPAQEGMEVTTRLCCCKLSLWGSQICWWWTEKDVLWKSEIASVTLEEAHVSSGYWESGCDNEVVKRWQRQSLPMANSILGWAICWDCSVVVFF